MSVLVQHPVPTGRLPLTISTRPTLQQPTTSQPSTGFVDHIETPLETPATGYSQFDTPIDAHLITPVNNPQVETVLQLFNTMPHSDQELRRFVQQQQLLADLLADIDNTESARKSQDQRRRQHLTMTTLRRALPDRIQLMRHKAGQDTDEHQRLDSFVHAWNTVDSWYDNRNGNIVAEQQPGAGAHPTSFTAKANHASTRTVQASVPCAARARAPSHGTASIVPPASGSALEGHHTGLATGHEVPIRYEHGGLGPRHVSQGNMPSRPSFPPTHLTDTTHVPSRFCADVFSGATSFTSSYNTTVSSVSVPCASGAPADGSCAAEAFGAHSGGPTMFLHPSTTMEQPAPLVNTHAGSNNLHQQNAYWNNGPAHTAAVNQFAVGSSTAIQQPLSNVNTNVITPAPNVERRDTPSRHIYGHKALALPDSRESPAFYDHKVRRLRDSAYWKKKYASIGGVTSTATSTPSNVTQTNTLPTRPLRGNFGEKIKTEAAGPIRNDTGGWSTALPQKAHGVTRDAAGFASSVPSLAPTIVPGGDASSSFPTTLVKNTHHNNAPTNDQLNTALFATTTTGNTNSEQIDFGSLNSAGHFGAAAAAPFNPHHASADSTGHWGRPGVPAIQDVAGTHHCDTVGNDGATTFFDAEEDLNFVERIISDESPYQSPIGVDSSGGNEVTPPIDASTYANPMVRIASGGARPTSLTYPPGLYPNYQGDAVTSDAHVAARPAGAAPINTSAYRTPVVASKEALYAMGHWLASHIVGRLVHVNAALGSDSDVAAASGNQSTTWPLASTMRSPVLSRRSYPTDPYGVLNTHGYTSGTFKPHRDFAMFVNHLIDAHDIPAEVLVAAVWYLDRLPVHDIDGERGIRFRQLLCNIPPQETFGIERRLLFITLLLAGIAVTDEPCFTPPWSEATGVPKVDGAQLKTEAIMCLHQRGSIALRPETWLNHCTAVYSGLSKMTLDHQMGWLLLDVCHRMSANARDCVDVDSATRARHSVTMDALNMGGNAAAIHALRAYVDLSQMPSPVPVAPETFPEAAPAVVPMIVDVVEDLIVRKGKDVYAPFDGAPEFPDPFFEDDDDDDSLPPPPPCPSRRVATPQQVVSAKQQGATGPNGDDDESSCSDEQFLEYDGAVPFPGPRMFKPGGGSATPPLERRNSLLSNGTIGSSGPTTPVLERVRSWRASLEVPVAADPTGPSIASRFRSVPMVPLSSGNGSSYNGSQWRVVSGASGDAPFADDFLAPFTPEKKAKVPHHPYQYHTVTGARPSRFSSNMGFGFFAKR